MTEQSFRRHLSNLDDLDDLLDGAAEIVHAGGEKEGGAANASGPASAGHPIAVEALHQSNSVVGDALRLVTKLEQGGEAGDVVGWVDKG